MIRKALFVLFLLAGTVSINAQTFIGMEKENVIAAMKSENPDYNKDETVKNEKYNYLKYLSDDGLETWIIVFDSEERCTAVRVTCASSLLTQKRKELNEQYTKSGTDKWSIDYRTGSISVELKNETWYFTITYRPAPKL